MPLPNRTPTLFAMTPSPFDANNQLDEHALRLHLRRMAAASIGVYLGTPGAGEGHTLGMEELGRIYEIGTEELKGTVPVYASGLEPQSAKALWELAAMAERARLDAFQVFSLHGGHGMKPTDQELETFFNDALEKVKMPALISVHVVVGYLAPIPVLERVVKNHPQIIGINCMKTGSDYVIRLMDALAHRVRVYTHIDTALNDIPMGVSGSLAAEPNIAPRLCQSLYDHIAQGNLWNAGEAQANITRLSSIVNRWAPSTARWVKMALKVLGLPGGNLRRPYLMPDESAQREMAAAFDMLQLKRLESLA